MGRGARLDAIPLPPIAAHSTITVAVPLVPLRRFALPSRWSNVQTIGIFFAMYRVSLYGDVISLPKRHPTGYQSATLPRWRHASGTVGDSEDIGLREYRSTETYSSA